MLQGDVTVYSPPTLVEALRVLAEGGGEIRPLAGGTDAMVKFKDGLWRPRAWVNLLHLRGELNYIRRDGHWLEVGALTTFSELLASPLIRDGAPLLAKAARTIGGPQIRNMGTIGGNIGTASPAGDSLPALYALEATVIINNNCHRPIDQFMLGPGRLKLASGELITGVRFRAQSPDELCTFEKLGLRAAHAISIASVAVRLGAGMARVALGAVAPTVSRVPAAEAALVDPINVTAAVAAAKAAAMPISDVRAGAGYRRAMAGNLLLRGLIRLLGPEVMPDAAAR
ncbi:MAG TPA: FAD binding domain-containing protein [Symbiobacteriaceae bacterium]|nr:FAD binding domain-containing protein [Symbiobacteriaceae bacterium]